MNCPQGISRTLYSQILLVLLTSILFGCNKEGYGGRAVIHGKLKKESYTSDFSTKVTDEYLGDEYVYIIFGDQDGYGDRVRTAHDGSFEFINLGKGTYSIYSYSTEESATGTSSLMPVVIDVNVEKSKEIIDIGDLVIKDNFATGNGNISGKVFGIDQASGANYAAIDFKVYIEGIGNTIFEESVRTNLDGEYTFSGLNNGDYRVYVLSKDVNNLYPGDEYPIIVDTTITSSSSSVSLADIFVYE